jgi:hypothetical protein
MEKKIPLHALNAFIRLLVSAGIKQVCIYIEIVNNDVIRKHVITAMVSIITIYYFKNIYNDIQKGTL